ncbi:hypothetical protein BH11PLA1_BH11PLA1_12160 [soil metagenome]
MAAKTETTRGTDSGRAGGAVRAAALLLLVAGAAWLLSACASNPRVPEPTRAETEQREADRPKAMRAPTDGAAPMEPAARASGTIPSNATPPASAAPAAPMDRSSGVRGGVGDDLAKRPRGRVAPTAADELYERYLRAPDTLTLSSANVQVSDLPARAEAGGAGARRDADEVQLRNVITPRQQSNLQALGAVAPTPMELPDVGGMRLSEIEELWVIERAAPAPKGDVSVPGCGTVTVNDGRATRLLPRETTIDARVDACIASVTYGQTFGAPGGTGEGSGTYVLPLPRDGAVTDFVVTLGGRQIRAVVRERAEARRLYEAAVETGHRAMLATAEPGNVFAARLEHLNAGEEIGVSATYFHVLPYAAGNLVLTLPTRGAIGTGGHVRGTVRINAAMPIEALTSGHAVEFAHATEGFNPKTRGVATFDSARGTWADERDLEVRIGLAADSFRPGLITYADTEGNTYFAALFMPPRAHNETTARHAIEWQMVIDRSQAVSAEEWALTRRAVAAALTRMAPEDRVRLFFTGGLTVPAAGFGSTQMPARAGLEDALRTQSPGGADLLAPVLEAALAAPGTPQLQRIVLLFTPGKCADQGEVLALVQQKLKFERVVSVLIGGQGERGFLSALARCGRGALLNVAGVGDVDDCFDRYFEFAARPVLIDMALGFSQTQGKDMTPRRMSDLSLRRPVMVMGRFINVAAGIITVSGRAGPDVKFTLMNPAVTDGPAGSAMLPRVWARAQMHDRALWATTQSAPTLSGELRDLAQRWSLPSPWTALVLIDGVPPPNVGEVKK